MHHKKHVCGIEAELGRVGGEVGLFGMSVVRCQIGEDKTRSAKPQKQVVGFKLSC